MRPESIHLSPRAISALLDGEMGFPEVREARLHLSRCGRCRGEFGRWEELDCRLALALPGSRPRPGLLGGLQSAIREIRRDGPSAGARSSPRRGILQGAAAAAVVILAGLAWVLSPAGPGAARVEQRGAQVPPIPEAETAPVIALLPVQPEPLSPPAVPGRTLPRSRPEAVPAPRPAALAARAGDRPVKTESHPPAARPPSLQFVIAVRPPRAVPPAPEEPVLAAAEPAPVAKAMARSFAMAALNPSDPAFVYEEEGRWAAAGRPLEFETEELTSWRTQALGWQASEEERLTEFLCVAFAVPAWN